MIVKKLVVLNAKRVSMRHLYFETTIANKCSVSDCTAPVGSKYVQCLVSDWYPDGYMQGQCYQAAKLYSVSLIEQQIECAGNGVVRYV